MGDCQASQSASRGDLFAGKGKWVDRGGRGEVSEGHVAQEAPRDSTYWHGGLLVSGYGFDGNPLVLYQLRSCMEWSGSFNE